MKRISTVIFILLISTYVLKVVVFSKNNDTQSELLLHVPSPEWQDQIIYFLMTDRFADGDPSNNVQGANEYDPSLESKYSGGDLQGVIDNLDYIKNLGATAVWTTPVVANQWWSNHGNYGGYHGYWATDFSQVDAHNGTLETYQQLSSALHQNGMYLIQDIVVNHTGNFFGYQGGIEGYDHKDTANNFYLFETQDSLQPKPTQAPFDLIDRNNSEHVKADIYNWTPSITDFSDLSQQYTYQLATLADLNTKNPVVINKFKQIYGDWIKQVGVDAFRIDTVRYVEHEFFNQFMHDKDGIHAVAKATGRDHFLAFGEVFDTAKPYQNDAEHRVASYLGTSTKPELNSLISFPLHHELKTVFAQGFPTDHLAYRLKQHMEVYPNPFIIPTFIDNHDMARFLASGDIAGFKQALATILTIPGIPTIYQGSAQAMVESRQAMFKDGFLSDKNHFDQSAELYQFIAKLAQLRTSDKLFTRGELNIIASNKNGPGVFGYTRHYQGRTVLVMFNTSAVDILVDAIQVSEQAGELHSLIGQNKKLILDNKGQLTTSLKGRSIIIAELNNINQTNQSDAQTITISTQAPTQPVVEDFVITGRSSLINQTISIIKNTQLNSAKQVQTDSQGNWEYVYQVANLGQENVSLIAYDQASLTVSNRLEFKTQVTTPELTFNQPDPENDDVGLSKNIRPPQHKQSIGQMDIIGLDAQIGGDVLNLTFTMRELTTDWNPANGFDNVAFSVFIDVNQHTGMSHLPLLNSIMPNNWRWDIGHVAYGWGNTTFSTASATPQHQGKKFGVAPKVSVNKPSKSITFSYKATDFGIKDWENSKIFATTWDITGEGAYRELQLSPSNWAFSGATHDQAKVLDAVTLVLSSQ